MSLHYGVKELAVNLVWGLHYGGHTLCVHTAGGLHYGHNELADHVYGGMQRGHLQPTCKHSGCIRYEVVGFADNISGAYIIGLIIWCI